MQPELGRAWEEPRRETSICVFVHYEEGQGKGWGRWGQRLGKALEMWVQL